ncbi:macrophage-expressed gene 1 protein-like [Antedon mediterranea]|uniref:macrophage-expressed gene 1 protein-like n=1 Tax=Antedon mediterranea TaxID=105859 RepID=UPI003AF419BF
MLTPAEWQNSLPNNLVAIDKDGDPLHYIVTTNTLPDIAEPTVTNVSNLIYEEIKRYYDVNTYKGCIDMDSANYNSMANTDDGSCIARFNAINRYPFGGVYQTCEMKPGSYHEDICPNLMQKNPLTARKSAIHLLSYLSKRGTAVYKTFWCHAVLPIPGYIGYLFGGVYTSTRPMPNPLTETYGCPHTFYPLRMGSDLFVCVNGDYDLGYEYTVPFAGFFNCSMENPYTISNGVWLQACPAGYSQHLATIDNDCRIAYCIQTNAHSDVVLSKIKRPPYTILIVDSE